MSKRKPNAAESRHLAHVASLDCVLCAQIDQPQTTRTTVHHVREGAGMAQRAGHFCTVALCEDCHQKSRHSLHGDRALLRIANVSEMDLLDATYAALATRGAA